MPQSSPVPGEVFLHFKGDLYQISDRLQANQDFQEGDQLAGGVIVECPIDPEANTGGKQK